MPIIKAVGPVQLKINRKYFIVLCRAIVAQQISTKAADTIYSRFLSLFAGKAPTPTRVANLEKEILKSVGLSRQKTSYIQDLADKFLDKTIRPRQFATMGNEEIIKQLTQVHGIGRWTAEMFLIFSLNRLDVLPVDDLGFRAGVKKIYKLKTLPTAKKIRPLAKKWQPLETVATWYAWRVLNPDIVVY